MQRISKFNRVVKTVMSRSMTACRLENNCIWVWDIQRFDATKSKLYEMCFTNCTSMNFGLAGLLRTCEASHNISSWHIKTCTPTLVRTTDLLRRMSTVCGNQAWKKCYCSINVLRFSVMLSKPSTLLQNFCSVFQSLCVCFSCRTEARNISYH